MRRNILSLFIVIAMAGTAFLVPPQKKAEALFDGGAGWANFAKEMVADTITTTLQNRMINKMIDQTFTWAAGGFDGEPGFINNWGDFLKGTEHDVLSGAYGLANTIVGDVMQNYGVGGGIGDGDPGNQAQNNYNLWVSGEIDTARMVASTIANFGSQQLHVNRLESIIRGEGETLSTLLGSREAKEAFKTDFSVGGWEGYLALIDPHNTDIGLTSLVQSELARSSNTAVQQAIQDVQTENKFLNITSCAEYGVGSDGEEICTRSITDTPGNIISNQIFQAASSDIERSIHAREVSDVLARALGKVVGSLLGQGISSLIGGPGGSSGGGTASFVPGEVFLGDYQSGYDVLGLNLGGSGTGGSGSGGTGTGGTSGGGVFDPFGDLGADGSLPYIGGPEDRGQNYWDGGPEIIIDLQEVLERSIELTRQELANYTEVERLLRNNADNIISLDRCVPGPGIGWEDRMKDVADIDSDSEAERRTLKRMNLSDTKRAATDPLINIPGAQRMKSLVESMLQTENISEANQISLTRQQKTNILGLLLNIESAIRLDFDTYRQEYHPLLPLFKADWNNLTEAQKLQIFSLRYDENGNITSEPYPYPPSQFLLEQGQGTGGGFLADIGPQYLVAPWYLFKPGETPESVLAENEELAMNAVLSFSWDLWQKKKGEEPATEDTPSGVKQKSNTRYRYYVMQNNMSTEADVLRSSLKIDETIENNKVVRDFLDDCIQLRHFVTGHDKVLIAAALLNPFTSIGGLLGGGSGTMSALPISTVYTLHDRTVRALNVSGAKTDLEIKNYLEQQREQQNQGFVSDFKTDLITGEGSIESSILNFDSEDEKLEYFTEFYAFETDGELEEWQSNQQWLNNDFFTSNATSIAMMLWKDYSISNWPRGGNGRGTLFCRLETNFDSRGQGGRQSLSDCAKDWYTTSNVEYRSKMAGI